VARLSDKLREVLVEAQVRAPAGARKTNPRRAPAVLLRAAAVGEKVGVLRGDARSCYRL
jgi:hypothetical protein